MTSPGIVTLRPGKENIKKNNHLISQHTPVTKVKWFTTHYYKKEFNFNEMNSHQTSKEESRFGNSHIHYKIVCSKIVDANVDAINNSYQIPSKLTKLRRRHFPGSTLLKVKTHLSSINNINWISVFIGSISF